MPTALIGARLRERRLAAGLRQAEVAAAAGISASYLNLIEHNRRNVTPEVLERLAMALDTGVETLAGASPGALVEDLRAAAAALPESRAEVERIEDFAARYPGWAALVAGLHGRAAGLERAVEVLNDRLSHDPHLSAALHELLSAMSGVRATAAILAETEDLSPDWQRRFHANLYQDSERLALGAEALVGYLDRSEATPDTVNLSPQEQVEAWLAARDWHLPEPGSAAADALDAEVAALPSDAARSLGRTLVAELQAEAAALPLAPVRAALESLGPDPAALARQFGTGVLAAMRRIALLPGAEAGLVLCDASGTLLFRKPAPGFALPRFGAACPLWPLFSALARPGLPVMATVEAASGGALFRTLAHCETRLPFGFAGPDLRTAAMLILPATQTAAPAVPVGSTCRICPRGPCPARREPSILALA
ncbi:helix-turn-helix domain-containing protein [Neotabrizicola sp. VNH66]|uniref:helix-turn-helix domain-containing protein n=1 Tax=Neotabrizicola sp. VNH66 TaxID=3400918 RepID=UPI003C098CC5